MVASHSNIDALYNVFPLTIPILLQVLLVLMIHMNPL